MPIFVNHTPIKSFNFAGGECHISIADIPVSQVTEITAWLYNSDDILQLLLCVDAIRRCNHETRIHLTVPYFPYARQDRVCNHGEALSVSVMAALINSLECARVTIYDPHSDVTAALVKNVTVIHQANIIAGSSVRDAIVQNSLVLLAPDAGAEQKTTTLAKLLAADGLATESMFASKVRDVKDGAILKTTVPTNIAGKSFLVVDDICDGGRTFIELAKELRANGAQKLFLYVTHGIFSKGFDELKEHFTHIYCFHSFQTEQDIDFLTVLRSKQ